MNTEEEKSQNMNAAHEEQGMPEASREAANTPAPTSEDKPVESMPVSEPAPSAPIVKKESWGARAARWVLVALIFLILGAAGIYFTLTMAADQQVATLSQAATASANQIATLQSGLQSAQADYTSATATVEAQNAQISSLGEGNAVYKMISDVDAMRVALLRSDTITANQALSNARDDVAALKTLGVDASTVDGFTTRLNNAAKTISSSPQQSLIELDNLIDNLYLLATNLK